MLFGNSSTDLVFSYNQINKQAEKCYVNLCIECFRYFTQVFIQCEESIFVKGPQ